jgi:nucleotide-binding universal stress UspA family protein
MGYRTVLVEMNTAGAAARLRAGRALAERSAAALIAMHVTEPLDHIGVWVGARTVYLAAELVEAGREAGEAARAGALAAFRETCGSDGPAASWRTAEGERGALLADAARGADLAVAGGAPDGTGIVEALTVASGVPVLMLPEEPPADVGSRRVLVAWNGRREAVRAVHDAMPFLRRAATSGRDGGVTLLAVGEAAAASLGGAAAMLARHGIAAESANVEGSDGAAGEILLAEASRRGADLLVMGAYGHARLRELVLGGATRHVLRRATLPVLFGG